MNNNYCTMNLTFNNISGVIRTAIDLVYKNDHLINIESNTNYNYISREYNEKNLQ